MNERLQRMYGELVARRAPADRTGCPSPEELLRLAERRVPEASRVPLLDHVMACAQCRPELDLLRSIVAAGERSRPARMPMLALAASLLVVAGAALLWQTLRPGRPMQRGGGPGAEVVLLAPGPGAALADPPALVWQRVPEAIRYRLELLDAEGGVVARWSTEDTATAVPDAGVLRDGAEYQWWVRAELTDNTQRRSEVRRFRMR